MNSSSKDRLSSFGERLQSLSDSFYSTIVEESKENKFQIKTAKQLENVQCQDFTFDQCSTNDLSSKDEFSFTFHSIDQTKIERKSSKKMKATMNHCSTPNSTIRNKNNFLKKKCEEETIVVDEQRSPPKNQPMIIGYYPVVTYQPIPFIQSPIYLTNQQIQK